MKEGLGMTTPQPEMIHAIELAKSGKKTEAAKILSQILKLQPDNEAAWLWLASCLKTNQQKLYCLNQALAINPDNTTTQKAIQKIKESQKKPPEEPASMKQTEIRPKSIVVPVNSTASPPKQNYLLPILIISGILILFLVFIFWPKSQSESGNTAYEGLYLSNLDTGYYNDKQTYYLLRFYSDGTVMAATIVGAPEQIGDMWPVFVYQNKFTIEHKEDFAYGQVQYGQQTQDGTLITFMLQYKYPGHPDYAQRNYTGYINENVTYLSECSTDQTNCINRYYERVDMATATP